MKILQRFKFDLKNKQKGQSFVELILVFFVLMTILTGMTEFGLLLNRYITLVDGAREGARFVSNDDPFEAGFTAFYDKVYLVIIGDYDPISKPDGTKGALNPIILNPDDVNGKPGDDIVVSIYSLTGGPLSSDRTVKLLGQDSRYGNHTSKFDPTSIAGMVTGTEPNSGILLVEVFYNYNQILKMFTFIGDPIAVDTYSMMPLSSAEPTPTPKP